MKLALASIAIVALVAAGCGGGGNGKPTIKVSAAASLKSAFERYAKDFDAAHVSYSFAGSDELAAQIREGVKPDDYAAANTKLPDDLYAKGLVSKPIQFATNRLVIAVPKSSTKVRSIDDLAKPGVSIAAGSSTVPIGAYTRTVLARLPAGERAAIERNIKSNEPDVAGVVGKIAEGAVDAGFVYVTDVNAASGKLTAVQIPASLQPTVVYGATVVNGAAHPDPAKQFIDGLVNGSGRQALAAAGFGPPPQ
jgi:molybdate transport system substrate-binding protein